MRKSMMNLVMLTTFLSAAAQFDRAPEIVERNDPNTMTHATHRNVATPGTEYYLETFDEGLGEWTSQTQQGVVQWKWTDSGPGPTSSFYPVPPLNTTAGWAIIDDDHDGYLGHTCMSSLISPVIDLSDAPPGLKLQFDQYYQEFLNDNTFIGFSTDGGWSWTEIEVNQGVGRENRPNPETRIINISSLIAGSDNVRLRFRYQADWSYGWQLDNIGIFEPAPYELVLDQCMLSHVGGGIAYGRIPSAQLGAQMFAEALVSNGGSLPLTNVVVKVEIHDQFNALVHSGSSEPIQMQPWDTVLVEYPVPIPFLNPGLYHATFTATSAEQEMDEEPLNNVLLRNFEVNDDFYALDADGLHPPDVGALSHVGTDNFEDGEDGLYLMNSYVVNEPVLVYGIQVELHESSVPGGIIFATILDSSQVMAEQVNITVAETPLHDITQAHITAGRMNLLFPQPVTLNGSYYAAVALHSLSGEAHLHVLDDVSLPQPPLAALIFITGEGVFTNGNAYAIRLILDGGLVAMDERNVDTDMAIFPNPTEGMVTFTSPHAGAHSIEVHDLAGQLVHVARSNGPGSIDLSHLAPAVYMMRVRHSTGEARFRVVRQ